MFNSPRRIGFLVGAGIGALFAATACTPTRLDNTALPSPVSPSGVHSAFGGGEITHVVVIVQENRSVDDLFNGFPGASTVQFGRNSHGQTVALRPILLTAPYDLGHTHPSFLTEYDNGALDAWNKDAVHCRKGCPPPGTGAYGFVPQFEVAPYWTLASEYVLADNMFQTNAGPSFPAHQYIISGTSTTANGSALRASENPTDKRRHTGQDKGGCDSPAGTIVRLIDDNGDENQTMFPCFERLSILDLADNAGVTWKYYQAYGGGGLWNAVDAIKQIWQKPEFRTNVVWPPSQILTDVANGNLAEISFVTPTALASDHALRTDGSGPSWVASVVNAIGSSQYWNNTAIFVTWDDWGGWFDHVAPNQYNSYELGFRVPLLVISPYAKNAYVSHVQHEFGSILKFTEETFGLGSLGTTDVRADDLSDCFNFNQSARKYSVVRAKYAADYFKHQPVDQRSPDDE